MTGREAGHRSQAAVTERAKQRRRMDFGDIERILELVAVHAQDDE